MQSRCELRRLWIGENRFVRERNTMDFVKGEIQYVMKKQNSSDLDRDGIRIVLEVRGANSNLDS